MKRTGLLVMALCACGEASDPSAANNDDSDIDATFGADDVSTQTCDTVEFEQTSATTVLSAIAFDDLWIVRTGDAPLEVSVSLTGASELINTSIRFDRGGQTRRRIAVLLSVAETFTVTLSQPSCGTLGANATAEVVVVDDTASADPDPDPGFSLAGTIEGLTGSGLTLRTRTATVSVSAGATSFVFPNLFPAGTNYEVIVATQPQDPAQSCRVVDGEGVLLANVSNVRVLCEAITLSSGLDPSFSTDGIFTITGFRNVRAVLEQPDGKLLVAGQKDNPSNFDFALLRLTESGELDTGFGVGGIVVTNFPLNGNDVARAMALDAQGRVLVAGHTAGTGSTTDFAVARYLADGELDASFDGDGLVTVDFFGFVDQAQAIVVLPDGTIMVGGSAVQTITNNDFALVRLLETGAVDSAFGKRIYNVFGNTDLPDALLRQSDGKLVLVGRAGNGVPAAIRVDPSGVLDPSFDGDGKWSYGANSGVVTGVAQGADGRVYLGGYSQATSDDDFFLTQVGTDNSFTSFAFDLGGDNFARAMTLTSDGRPIIVGEANGPTSVDVAAIAVLPSGELDPDFFQAGVLLQDVAGQGDVGRAICVDSSNRIVIAADSGSGIAVMRLVE